jgi:hypothetical protein
MLKLTPALTALAILIAIALPSTAAAKSCSSKGLSESAGIGIVNVRATNVSCGTARTVVKRAMPFGKAMKRSVRVAGRKYTCRTTQKATGTDPGYTSRTKVRCSASGGRIVKFWLAS